MGIHLLPPQYELVIKPARKTAVILCDSGSGYVVDQDVDYTTCHDKLSSDLVFPGVTVAAVGQRYGAITPPPPDAYSIRRAGLIFDTTGLPADAQVMNVILSLYIDEDRSDQDFVLTVVDGSVIHNPIVKADYGALLPQIESGGSLSTIGITVNQWSDIVLNPFGRSLIQIAAETKLGLRSGRDIGAIVPAYDVFEYIRFRAYYADSAYRAKLTIEYTSNL